MHPRSHQQMSTNTYCESAAEPCVDLDGARFHTIISVHKVLRGLILDEIWSIPFSLSMSQGPECHGIQILKNEYLR